MTFTSELAEHFVDVPDASLPPDRLAEMRRLLVDYCAVVVAGSQTDSGRIAGEFAVATGGVPESTVVGRAQRVPALHAAFANAVAEHSIELDDVDDEALFHYGPPVVSAALAVAEATHSSGAALLGATLLGCEMTNRLSLATNPALRDRGFHTTPACGVFGAAVAAGRLLGLNTTEMTSALGLAGAQASGLMEMYGPSMQKRVNPGPAARNGVTAAVLAKLGFTGADSILEGEHGFGIAFAGGLDGERLVKGLGSDYPVPVEYKAYSAARPIHNAIDCALMLRAEGVLHTEVERIRVRRHPAWARYHTNARPRTYHEAQVSLPYSVAVALVDGAALPAQYADDQLERPELLALSALVEIDEDPGLARGVSCAMTVTLRDGSAREVTVDDPRGSIGNPLGDEDLAEKLRMLAGPVLGETRTSELLVAVRELDSSESVGHMLRLLNPAHR